MSPNSATSPGVVAAGTTSYNKVWKTDCLGNPGWRTDSSGTEWTKVGNDIYNNNSGNVGIGLTNPQNKLDVEGGDISVNGANGYGIRFFEKSNTVHRIFYSGTTNSLNFNSFSQMYFNQGFYTPGNVGIGTTTPSAKLDVQNSAATGSTGYF